MRFSFIQEHRGQWPVGALCRTLGVTRPGYGAWQRRHEANQEVPSLHRQEDARLTLCIKAAHRQGRRLYGSPRVHRTLRQQGVCISRKRVARLMRQAGLRGVCRGRRKPCTTQSNPRLPVAANLLERRFTPEQVGMVNRVWCGDITYVPTAEGWLYLATVQDLFSRRIVGWALGENLEAELVCEAFEQAMQTRGSVGSVGFEKLFHSDRGSQYAGWWFERTLDKHGIPSMSRKGNCWDNAVAEFFRQLQK